VLRVVEELTGVRALDHTARVHNHDLVRYVRDDAEVMRDQDDRRIEVVLQPVDQLDDLGLDRHVEGSGRLVRDQHVRVACQRHRDHRALPHPTGELVRVIVDSRLGVRNPDLLQQLDRAPFGGILVGSLVDLDRFADLRPDRVHGVQRRHRVLEDHGHLVAAHVLQLALVHLQHVAPLVEHLALEARVLVAREAEKRHRRDALARARLAHDPEHLPALQLEVDTVDGLDDPVLGGELDLQAVDLDQSF